MIDTDAQLIERARAGNRQAAEQLIGRHRRVVYQIAYRALQNADDAQDVAQETLVYLLLRLSELRDPAKLPGWLRHITLSCCADYRRNRATRRLGDPLTVLNERAENRDFARRLAVRQAVAHLSSDHQTTLLLHYAGGWSVSEVADLLEIPVNTVRSRLMRAKHRLRADLDFVEPKGKKMSVETASLSETQIRLLNAAFPGARILSVQNDPEPWMPFTPRVRLQMADGDEKTVDFRTDLTPERARLAETLRNLGIPGPRIIHGPTSGGSLCETPRGENLLLWAMGGTPHRIRLATERSFETIDRLQDTTEALQNDPVGKTLDRRSLLDEVEILTDDDKWNTDSWLAEVGADRRRWLNDSWFAAALRRVTEAVADTREPLVYTNYVHFFPLAFRIYPGHAPYDEPVGWPDDPCYAENPLAEVVWFQGHFGDPLLGLAMVWLTDCYPFVHTGFVEQFLWRRGVSRREFAPRLALKALQMIARDAPIDSPEPSRYAESLKSWAEQALDWM